MALSDAYFSSLVNENQIVNAISAGELTDPADIMRATRQVFKFADFGELERLVKGLTARGNKQKADRDAATAAAQAAAFSNVPQAGGWPHGQSVLQDGMGRYVIHPTGGYKIYEPDPRAGIDSGQDIQATTPNAGGTTNWPVVPPQPLGDGSNGTNNPIVNTSTTQPGAGYGSSGTDLTAGSSVVNTPTTQPGAIGSDIPGGSDDIMNQGGRTMTMADFIRNVESQTLQGRRNVFDRYADAQAFNRFLNPLAQSVMSRQFDPLSSQYLLAAAPTAAGGSGLFNTGAAGTGMSFQDFLGGGARPAYAGGAYGEMTGTPVFGAQGTMGMNPWTRDQWQTRIGNLFAPAAEGATDRVMPTGLAGDFLGGISMGEAANMISNAQRAGLNPIVARSAPAGINRQIAAWQQENPTAGGAELLRQYASGNVFGNFV